MNESNIREFLDLNWAKPSEINDHLNLIPPQWQLRLANRLRGMRLFPERFARPDQYCLENSTILVLSDYNRAWDLCACSLNPLSNFPSRRRCGLWAACPYCCYRKKLDLLDRFRTVPFQEGRFGGVTIRPRTAPTLRAGEELDVPAYCTNVWNGANRSLRQLIRSGLISGLISVESLSVEFQDRRGGNVGHFPWPHMHALVLLAEQQYNTPTENQEGFPLGDCFWVNWKDIADEQQFKNVLEYLIQPVDWVSPYQAAWTRLQNSDRSTAGDLNQHTTSMVNDWETATADRRRIRYLGNFSPSSRSYVGATKATMSKKGYRKGTMAWMRQMNAKARSR